jgi:23S rRNA pseudouridine955/2504/2580 synthase
MPIKRRAHGQRRGSGGRPDENRHSRRDRPHSSGAGKSRDAAPSGQHPGEPRKFRSRKPKGSFGARDTKAPAFEPRNAAEPARFEARDKPRKVGSHKSKGSFGGRHEGSRSFEPRAARSDARAAGLDRPKRNSFDFRKPRERVFESRPPRQVQPEPKPVPPLPEVAIGVQIVTVSADESGMRVDRFFSHIQRIVRKGEVRMNGKRVDTRDRLAVGQQVRIPPLKLNVPKRTSFLSPEDEKTRAFLQSITLHEDADVLVLNKPMGLSVQGGSGTARHLDGMLEVLRQPGPDGQRPRLVHRLDKDTAGCLLVAKTRFAAAALAKTFRARSARKIYWALTAGVPKPRQGRISTFLAKEEREEDSFMRIAQHGEEGASHAITYYAVVETSASTLAWVSLKPVTGRTHQLRAHMAYIGHPIVGDPKYFRIENWELPGGLQNRLHLLARRIAIPHPRGGTIDVTAPLPPHMQQSWNLLGLDAARYDPILDAPEE